jgi:hypothetical protein
MKNKIIETLGWYGVVAILSAYALLSFNIIISDSFFYQFLNFTGASIIALLSFYKHNLQPAVLNVIWALIAIVALSQIIW